MLTRAVNMIVNASQPDENTVMNTTEKEALSHGLEWRATGTAYAQEHCTRPSTIGNVISSNPLAILAW